MERKNTILLTVIAIATLLVAVVGATFAYFTATITDNRDGDANKGQTNIQAGQVSNTTVVASVDGAAGNFTASDVFPGHKEVAALSVTANGAAGSKTAVDFIYEVTTNELGASNVKVGLYKSTTKIETGTSNYFACEKKTAEGTDGATNYFEECTAKSTGDLIKETTLTGGAQTVTLGQDIITTTTADTDETVYYYVVVEFINQSSDQNAVMGKTLAGKVTVSPAA